MAHAGRTTVVIEVELYDDAGREIGLATMSFAVLPRRDANPDIKTSMESGPSTMALPTSRLQAPLLDELEVEVVDAARGVIEAPVGEWSLNSLGAMQGGAVATLVDAAAEAAAATRRPETHSSSATFSSHISHSHASPRFARASKYSAPLRASSPPASR